MEIVKNDVFKKLNYKNLKGPISVAFTITKDCNFRCLHCYNESGATKSMTATQDELLFIAEQIAELEPVNVCLCGGETLIDYETTIKIVKYLNSKIGNLNMVSNGFLATKDRLIELKESGIHTFQVSLDGDNNFTHDNMRRMPGSFEKAIETIKLAVEVGLKVAVSFVPQKINYKYVGSTCDLCYKLGVTEFRVMPLIPMGRGSLIDKLLLTSEEYIELQQELLRKKFDYEYKMNVQWGDPIDHLYRLPSNAHLNLSSYSLEVNFDGNITVSTYLPIIVGNCFKYRLIDYWNAGYKDIWDNPTVKYYTEQINTVFDFNKPIFSKNIYIDTLNEKLEDGKK